MGDDNSPSPCMVSRNGCFGQRLPAHMYFVLEYKIVVNSDDTLLHAFFIIISVNNLYIVCIIFIYTMKSEPSLQVPIQ